MNFLTIKLFGEFSAVDLRGNSLSIGNRRTSALLIYAAMAGEAGASLSEAARLLFGDRDSEQMADVVASLRYALRYVAPDIVSIVGDEIRIDTARVSVDVLDFIERADSLSINSTREAAELYAGNLLETYSTGISAFDEWVAEQRLSFWRAALGVFGRLLAAQIKAGWWESAIDTAGRLLAFDPSQEVVHRTLMRLQLEQGRPDSALRRYQECADILYRDFARTPSPETERLRQEIVTQLDRTPAPRELFRNPVERPVLILLVEDDMVSSALVEGFLIEAGYGVICAADGAEALIEIGRREFDLLLLDINIPTLDGLRLFEIMIQKGIETPAIFITGVAGPEAEARSLEMGAADFLRKPLRKEVLLPRIRAILQHRERAARRHDR
jgi:CheY-like chemotaxis protein